MIELYETAYELTTATATARAGDGLPTPPDTRHPDAYGRVNPFNPCLHAAGRVRATSTRARGPAPFDDSPNWSSLN